MVALPGGCLSQSVSVQRSEAIPEAEASFAEDQSTACVGGLHVCKPPVGLRNCDHALDLRIRIRRQRRASASLDAREASVPHSIRCLIGEMP